MEDVGYVLLMIGFVVLPALFTIGCDKLIGPDEVALAGEPLGRGRSRTCCSPTARPVTCRRSGCTPATGPW